MSTLAQPRSVAFADSFLVPFEEAIAYHRQKVNLPTASYRDLEGRSHDRAFVVAGAMKEALLADLRAEIDKAIAGKLTLEQFRARFDEIVQRHGWTGWAGENSAAGRAWRTNTIFQTNMTTAYAAGRYRQMTDPDIVKVYKWWRYRHAFYRVPKQPREEHVGWNGRVIIWNHPWWEKHFPPNDWLCSCGVETLADRDLKAEGIEPEEPPADVMREVRDPKTGEKVAIPEGIGFGWDHTPGRDWSQGLVPPALQKPLQPSIGPARPPQLPPLPQVGPAPLPSSPLPSSRPSAPSRPPAAPLSPPAAPGGPVTPGAPPLPAPAPSPSSPAPVSLPPAAPAAPSIPAAPAIPQPPQPFTAPLMPEGLAAIDYVGAFLQVFGAAVDAAKLWRDPAGHAIVISDQLFRDGRGNWKIPFEGREQHVLRLAEAIMDPDEIWVDWGRDAAGRPRLVRRYLRTSPDSPEFASFAWSVSGWYGATAFSPMRGRSLLPDPDYLERQRRGALIWQRWLK